MPTLAAPHTSQGSVGVVADRVENVFQVYDTCVPPFTTMALSRRGHVNEGRSSERGRGSPQKEAGSLLILQARSGGRSNLSAGPGSKTKKTGPKTVDNHRTPMMEKLGVHGTAELVRFAAKHKLLS